jgi:uncharacterized protein DUF4382
MKLKLSLVMAGVVAIAIAVWLSGCSGGGSTQMAQVNTLVSDPATCSTTAGGPYSHVYVSISDVKIHQSATAGPNDSGWVDLTPRLTPVQIDLLNPGSFNGCFLAQLGSTTELQAGSYEQIRVFLTPDNVSVSGNNCSGTNNCVVYNGIMSPLELSSETQTGIKIPSGQLAGGKFTIGPGQTKDLGIDFDACASIVKAGHSFRLKPVLHAGEVSLTSESINGKLVDSVTGQAVAGATGIVALEANVNGIDRVIMQTTVAADGSFVFCPVPAGTYDIVAVIEAGSGAVAYSPTIVTGVQPGNALGKVPMTAQAAPNAAPGFLTGQVTTAGASGGIAEDITLSVLEPVTIGGAAVQVTIPLVQQKAAVVQTATVSDNSCPNGTDCLVPPYDFAIPTTLPFVGAVGTTPTQASGTLSYAIDAQAFEPASSSTPACTLPDQKMSVQTDGSSPLSPASGATETVKTITFGGCQ